MGIITSSKRFNVYLECVKLLKGNKDWLKNRELVGGIGEPVCIYSNGGKAIYLERAEKPVWFDVLQDSYFKFRLYVDFHSVTSSTFVINRNIHGDYYYFLVEEKNRVFMYAVDHAKGWQSKAKNLSETGQRELIYRNKREDIYVYIELYSADKRYYRFVKAVSGTFTYYSTLFSI